VINGFEGCGLLVMLSRIFLTSRFLVITWSYSF
jgi:hypothetical protein